MLYKGTRAYKLITQGTNYNPIALAEHYLKTSYVYPKDSIMSYKVLYIGQP
jgi:hypothetical protein